MLCGGCPDSRVIQGVSTHCLLFRIWLRVCEDVASDFGLGGGFQGYFGFLHREQPTGWSRIRRSMSQVMIHKIPNASTLQIQLTSNYLVFTCCVKEDLPH